MSGNMLEVERFVDRMAHHGQCFQVFLFLLLAVTCFQTSVDLVTTVFLVYTPTFHCVDSTFLSLTNATNSSAYVESVDACRVMLRPEGTGASTEVKCSQWSYDTSVMVSTMVTEFDLVCDNSHFVPLLEVLYILGCAVGSLLGILGDVFGRRKVILVSVVWEVIISIATPLVYNLNWLLALRFLRGLSTMVTYQALALIAELSPKRFRGLFGSNYWVIWAVGYVTGPGFAYYTRSWRAMKLYTCVPLVLYLCYPWVVPESPRWLLCMGRYEDAKKVFEKISKWNDFFSKSSKPQEPMEPMEPMGDSVGVTESSEPSQTEEQAEDERMREALTSSSGSKDHFLDVLRSPNMRIKTLIVWLISCTLACMYYGLLLIDNFASSNIFFNTFIMGVVEFPAGVISWLLVDSPLGRRHSLLLTFLVSCAGILCVPYLQDASLWLALLLCGMVAKLMLETAFCVGDLILLEIFPTSVRDMGLFTSTAVANIVSMLAPFINRISWTPGITTKVKFSLGSSLIYSAAGVLSTILVFCFIPETRNIPLPQTIAEAENLRRGNEEEWAQERSSMPPEQETTADS